MPECRAGRGRGLPARHRIRFPDRRPGNPDFRGRIESAPDISGTGSNKSQPTRKAAPDSPPTERRWEPDLRHCLQRRRCCPGAPTPRKNPFGTEIPGNRGGSLHSRRDMKLGMARIRTENGLENAIPPRHAVISVAERKHRDRATRKRLTFAPRIAIFNFALL